MLLNLYIYIERYIYILCVYICIHIVGVVQANSFFEDVWTISLLRKHLGKCKTARPQDDVFVEGRLMLPFQVPRSPPPCCLILVSCQCIPLVHTEEADLILNINSTEGGTRKHFILPKLREWNKILHHFMILKWVILDEFPVTTLYGWGWTYVEVVSSSPWPAGWAPHFWWMYRDQLPEQVKRKNTRKTYTNVPPEICVSVGPYGTIIYVFLHNHEKNGLPSYFLQVDHLFTFSSKSMVPTMSATLQTVHGLTFALFKLHIHIVEGAYDLIPQKVVFLAIKDTQNPEISWKSVGQTSNW